MLPVADQVLVRGSYSSAEALPPPATSTVPSGSSVAVWRPRAVPMLPVAAQTPVLGSESSAEGTSSPQPALMSPPATSTLPSGSSMAVACRRRTPMAPVAVQDPVLGSYSSADASAARPLTSLPSPPSPGHEHFAVGQQRGRVALARRAHCSGGGPGPRCAARRARRCRWRGPRLDRWCRGSHRPRAPCHRAAAWRCRPDGWRS